MAIAYDQNEAQTPLFLRVLWIALWLIVIGVVAWVFIWFIFLRGNDDGGGKLTTSKDRGSQRTARSGTAGSATNGGNGATKSSGTQSTPTTNPDQPAAGSGTSQPDRLANAGAGDVITPAALVGVVGGLAYHVRLRRKSATHP